MILKDDRRAEERAGKGNRLEEAGDPRTVRDLDEAVVDIVAVQ